MAEEYISLREQLTAVQEMMTPLNNELLELIRRLQIIHALIPESKQDNLFKLMNKRVTLKPLQLPEPPGQFTFVEAVMRVGKIVNRKLKDMSCKFKRKSRRMPTAEPGSSRKPFEVRNTNSEIRFARKLSSSSILEPGTLSGDVLDVVIDKVTWEWIERLNALLHEIMPVETALKMLKDDEGYWEALVLQKFVLRTVDFLYKHGVIPVGHLQSFFGMKDTMRFASIIVHDNWKILSCVSNRYWRYFTGPRFSRTFVKLVDKKGEASKGLR
ncbi:hypothetical protein PTTG_27914 [Puccinia triticina 1-1 BBBD Race 1]|uniref:Uncharacterized protein n=1 Tax=Puccinia triticina (isolate 1-1 / race 1 (BBBD)) TaxID=630390 RepID=A0A180GG74_PUCT1|nr:hypothetical protein PTTG_27914 [Puccinia triticina 1-1 BBBD Race 1]